LLAEQLCGFYAETLGVPVTIVRPFNVFGPGQRPEFLIPTILSLIRKRESITVKDLAPRRDYVFVDDLLDVLLRSIENPAGLRLFNVGSGRSHSVGEIIDIAQAVAGTKLPVIVAKESRRNEIPDVYADITRVRGALGWQPATDLARGIDRILREEAAVTRPDDQGA
jgi:nucleoside-diphosphate-sugar epimerase